MVIIFHCVRMAAYFRIFIVPRRASWELCTEQETLDRWQEQEGGGGRKTSQACQSESESLARCSVGQCNRPLEKSKNVCVQSSISIEDGKLEPLEQRGKGS